MFLRCVTNLWIISNIYFKRVYKGTIDVCVTNAGIPVKSAAFCFVNQTKTAMSIHLIFILYKVHAMPLRNETQYYLYGYHGVFPAANFNLFEPLSKLLGKKIVLKLRRPTSNFADTFL